jgi:hypothetical protein
MKNIKYLFFLFFLITASSVYAQNCDFEIRPPVPNPGNPLQLAFGHTSTSALDVLWEFGDDSTATFQGGVHTYASSGVYIYCVTIDTCPSICDTLTIVKTAGTNDFTQKNIKIYPNPSSDHFSVDFNLDIAQRINFKVLSSTGSVVLEKEIYGLTGDNHSTIELGELPKGIYTLRTVGVSGSLHKTILKL